MARRAYLELVKSSPLDRLAGARYPLGGTVVIGRALHCEVSLHDDAVTRRHADVRETAAGFEVQDMGGSNGTFVNGVRIERGHPLQPGDRLQVGRTELRMVVEDVEEHRLAGLEAEIAERPDDPGAWEVYGDWLLEQGDPRGQRIRGLDTVDARWLENAVRAVMDGSLQLTWHHGHVRTARLSLVPYHSDLLAVLGALVRLPIARFIVELELDTPGLFSQLREPVDVGRMLAEVTAVLEAQPLPALRALRFDPLCGPLLPPREPVVRARTAPRLVSEPLRILRDCAFLEGERRIQIGSSELRSLFSVALARGYRLDTTEAQSVQLNGRLLSVQTGRSAVLRPNDVVEAGGRRLIFDARP